MNTATEEAKMNYRMERIKRLLKELRYEVERGVTEREIEEEISYLFIIPRSKSIPNGVVMCRFETRPLPHHMIDPRMGMPPKLKIVGKEDEEI